MENTTKWHSCRLVAHSGSGRVRWCVGHEKSWQTKLKRLVFVPAILLTIVIISIPLTHLLVVTAEKNRSTRAVGAESARFEDNEVLDVEEKREILKDTRTSYIPVLQPPGQEHIRRKRDTYDEYPEDYTDEDFEDVPFDRLQWQTMYENTADVIDFELHNETEQEIPDGPSEAYRRDVTFWKHHAGPRMIRRIQGEAMIKYMNLSTDPCDDFYEYACGNWNKYNKMPADRSTYDTFEILRESLDSILRDLLTHQNEPVRPKCKTHVTRKPQKYYQPNRVPRKHVGPKQASDEYSYSDYGDAITKAKDFYKSCMNEAILQRRGSKPLLKLLKSLGGWPIIDPTWDEKQFDLIYLMATLRLYNNDILISEWIGPDIKNSDEYVIQIDQTTLGLPTREYFLESSNLKYLEAYRVYMLQVANLLGAEYVDAITDVNDVIQFETALADITKPTELRKNISTIYQRMTIGELYQHVPQIDWLKYFTIVLGQEITYNDVVVSYCQEYLHEFVVLISRTPDRILANYLLWRFVRHRVNNLDGRFQEVKQRFYYQVFGRERAPPRWQLCVTQVNSNMGMALGSLFVKNYFDETSRNDTLEMTRMLQNVFRDIINHTYWLDEETKDLARLKIDYMNLKIGYPDFILRDEELASRYSDIKIHPERYFENMLSILRHLARVEQRRLGTQVNKTVWGTPPAIVNAYYSRNKNQIMFPAGILQPPFYHRHFPHSLNFGGIGVVIGHEMTHGFDDKGRLFDKEGNLQRWWQDSSILQFHNRAKCLIDQYSTYVVPEILQPVDGLMTQGENIADNGGIKQAFKAYMEWRKMNPYADESLPGLNVTDTQLFFLNFAQVWCGSSRPEALRNKLKTALHAPGRFRVIGTLSNSEDFARVFSCPKGSPMNPVHKCSIW